MGLDISGSLTSKHGDTLEGCYARIDHYGLAKSNGYVTTTVGFYKSKEEAEPHFPIYQEDYAQSDASGLIFGGLKIGPGDEEIFPTYMEFPLTQSEQVVVTTYSASFEDKLVDYIDYDEDGNEVTKQRTQRVAMMHTGSEEVTKSRINMNLITGSVYEYAYHRVKEALVAQFGASNVNDNI
tara:strand:+ start:231 stop:773 length:543 start_codon:yes stop_codon:yes gene_type:complete